MIKKILSVLLTLTVGIVTCHEHPSYDVLGVGSSIIDLIIPVDDAFLKKIPGEKGGVLQIDFESMTDIINATGKQPKIATGGSCGNTLRGLTKLGCRCAQAGTVGQDSMGSHYIESLEKIGMTSLLIPVSKPTSLVLCLVTPDGQRTMRFFEGASKDMSSKDLTTDMFKGVKLVHIEGYSLRHGDLTESVMKMAKATGAKVSFDLSAFEIVETHRETIKRLIVDYVDILFSNEDETRTLTGLGPEEGCIYLKELCDISVVLVNENGCWIGHDDAIFRSPSFKAEVVDSTGAGDLFASGFLYGYLKGLPLDICACFGNMAGCAIVEVQGAELSEEKWDVLRHAIQTKEHELAVH